MNAPHWLNEVLPWLLNGGGFVVWIKLALDARQARKTQEASLIEIAQNAAKAVIQSLRDDNSDLRTELEGVKQEFAEFRQTHDAMIRDKDAELALLRGQVRQAWSFVYSFVRLLDEHDIPHEDPTQPAWLVEAGLYPSELADGLPNDRRRTLR